VAGRGAGLLSASRAGTDGPISTIIRISAGGLGSQSAGRTAEGALAVRASAVDGPQQWRLRRWWCFGKSASAVSAQADVAGVVGAWA
jgi:hypothetical protein